jgi:hypothetical protein
MKFFAELGRTIQERWVRAKCSEAAFPEVCASVLAEEPPSEHVSLDDVVKWGLTCERLPRQLEVRSDFGEPPLTVFSEERFFISVLVWLDGTTAIHEHGFAGAFHVLQGGSLHTTFDFDASEVVNENMMLGRLKERRIERLKAGDTREIHTGAKTIHQLFHLDRPSATVVARTFTSSFRRPQYSYFRPGTAVHPLYDFEEQKTRRDLMQLVARVHPEQLGDHYLRWLDVADPVGAFVGLRHCARLVAPKEGDELLARVQERQPELARLLRPVIENDRREAFIVDRRKSVTDPELRFFLAVLLNVEGRERALQVIADRFPGHDPVELVVRWVNALGKLPSPDPADRAGTSALGFHMDGVVAVALRAMLRASPRAETIRDASAFAKRSLSEEEQKGVWELCQALQSSEMFRSILQSGVDASPRAALAR